MSNVLAYNKNVPGGATNAIQGLTHSSGTSREGLAVKATRQSRPAAIPRPTPIIPPEVTLRALTRYYFESPTGCHVSTYSAGSHGYAQIGWNDRVSGKTRMMLCHRVVWSAIYGPIPKGMTIDHTCKTRKCINVSHLRLLDNYENARRTFGRDWQLGECINGHPDSYLRVETTGRLRCTACSADYQRTYRARKASA